MDIQDEDKVSSKLQSLLSFLTTFAQSFSTVYHLALFQPRRTFCILRAATMASSSESDSLWDVVWEELQGEEHSGEHK